MGKWWTFGWWWWQLKRLWWYTEGIWIGEVTCFVRRWQDRASLWGEDELCVASCWLHYRPIWVQGPKINRWTGWNWSQHIKGEAHFWKIGQPRQMEYLLLLPCIFVWITRKPIQGALSPIWMPISSSKRRQHWNTYTWKVELFLPMVKEGGRQGWGEKEHFQIESSSMDRCEI